MDLKNMTMDDLKQKLAAVDKKTLIKFGSGFGAIILFLIIYYVILNPMVKERKAKYNDKISKQNEISQFDNEIITFKSRIKEMKPDFDKTSTLFHSKAEVEDLYESLSKYAAVNGLVISKIEKKTSISYISQNLIFFLFSRTCASKTHSSNHISFMLKESFCNVPSFI